MFSWRNNENMYLDPLPALVAELDASLPDDQEVVGSTPAGLATFSRGD